MLTRFFQNLLHFKHPASLCIEMQSCLDYCLKMWFLWAGLQWKEENLRRGVDLCEAAHVPGPVTSWKDLRFGVTKTWVCTPASLRVTCTNVGKSVIKVGCVVCWHELMIPWKKSAAWREILWVLFSGTKTQKALVPLTVHTLSSWSALCLRLYFHEKGPTANLHLSKTMGRDMGIQWCLDTFQLGKVYCTFCSFSRPKGVFVEQAIIL